MDVPTEAPRNEPRELPADEDREESRLGMPATAFARAGKPDQMIPEEREVCASIVSIRAAVAEIISREIVGGATPIFRGGGTIHRCRVKVSADADTMREILSEANRRAEAEFGPVAITVTTEGDHVVYTISLCIGG